MQRWFVAVLAAVGCLLLWVMIRPRPSTDHGVRLSRPSARQPTFPIRGSGLRDTGESPSFNDFAAPVRGPTGSAPRARHDLLRARREELSSEGKIEVPAADTSSPPPELATRPKVVPADRIAVGAVTGAQGEGLLAEAALSLPFDDPQKGTGGLQPLAEKDVQFDEFGAVFGPNALFIAPPPDSVNSNAGSVVFWLQPAWAGDSGSNNAYFIWRMPHAFENRVTIFKNGPFLRFLMADSLGMETDVSYGVARWRADEWHHIGATWGDYVATFYVDGRPVGSKEYAHDIIIPPGTPWYIGSDYPGGAQGANSRIRGFHVFPRVLLPEEIVSLMDDTRPPGA
ncbi:MAG: LamG domain-containing protein [Candidatus Binatia bacterium]|nr:LamG domain-containing protein [Candidatus Binatia bacterium]